MPGVGPGLQLFFAYVGQDTVLEHLLGQHLLEFRVLTLQLLEPSGFVVGCPLPSSPSRLV